MVKISLSNRLPPLHHLFETNAIAETLQPTKKIPPPALNPGVVFRDSSLLTLYAIAVFAVAIHLESE